MIRFTGIIGAAFCSIVVMAAAAVHADAVTVYGTVEAKLTSMWPSPATAKVSLDFGGTTHSNVHVYVGQSKFRVMEIGDGDSEIVSPSLSGLFSDGQDFYGYCVDFQQGISFNQKAEWELVSLKDVPYPYTTGNPMGETRANWIRRLFHNNFASVGSDRNNAAAFQLAVWDLIYDAGDNDVHGASSIFRANDITSGSDSYVYNLANQWIAAAKTGDDFADVYALRSSTTQDFAVVLQGYTPDAPVVPLPAAAWMGMGLLGMLAAGRKAGHVLSRRSV